MSLINNMLKNLDERRDNTAQHLTPEFVSGMQDVDGDYTQRQENIRSHIRFIGITLFAVVIFTSLGYFLILTKKSESPITPISNTPTTPQTLLGKLDIAIPPRAIKPVLEDKPTIATTAAPINVAPAADQPIVKDTEVHYATPPTANEPAEPAPSLASTAAPSQAIADEILDKPKQNETTENIKPELTITKKSPESNRNKAAEKAYFVGLEHVKSRDFAKADRALRDALQHDPKHIQARELLYHVLLQQGHWRLAEQLLLNGINAVPSHATFSMQLARLYVEQGAHEQALLILESIRNQASEDVEYLAFLAILYQQAGQHYQATEAFEKALQQQPYMAKWWLGYALSLEAIGENVKARDSYLRARNNAQLDDKLTKYANERLAKLETMPLALDK